ncbi:hypothetical protein AZI86_16545 [Bdellovibrio bacteriovorus]|uniref:Pentapeptide MXKDX repeat protein n=1 Tax=Bdellovibrio bacteriovorus TaxID=959 RepID=A0A150WH67_BDEBC|nr:hypothetical protein [Bdellovibrio bacteriovorus]KYG62441.1 hypothetical protein AZI86_16545 [Bdellovibrio bacteriovorus]
MKHLVIVIAMALSSTAFANDPAAGHDTHGTMNTTDTTTPQNPADKNAGKMKKHKGSKGKDHPKVSQPGTSDTKDTGTHQ